MRGRADEPGHIRVLRLGQAAGPPWLSANFRKPLASAGVAGRLACAILGRQIFRHKTQKTWFTIKTWMIVVIHVVLVTAVLFFAAAQIEGS